MNRSTFTLLLLCLALVLSACSRGKSSDSEKDTTATLATVNGSKITEKQLENRVSRYALSIQDQEKAKAEARKVLDDLVNQEVIFQQLVKEDFYKRDWIKGQLVDSYLREKVEKSYKPTDQELKEYYKEHKAELEKVRVSHILFKVKKPGDPKAEEAAKQRAAGILARINKGENFEKLAKSSSEDTGTGSRGGDLRWIGRSEMPKTFSDAAFALEKVGDVSDVVKSDMGYHIIKLTAEQRSLADLKPLIQNKMVPYLRKKSYDTLIADLRKSASVDINEKRVAQFASGAK